MKGGLLVAGGAADPNMRRLLGAASARGLPVTPLLVGPEAAPRLRWDLGRDRLELDGDALAPDALFLRQDVFLAGSADLSSAQYRAEAWYGALSAWAGAHPEVRRFNRGARPTSKPETLLLAAAAGLAVPETLLTSDAEALHAAAARGWVAKPVTGGGHCRPLAELLAETEVRAGATAAPALIQPRLPGPDLRVYGVGARQIAYLLWSDRLDYRADPGVRIEPLQDPPAEIVAGLTALGVQLGLNWYAADLKCDAGGVWRFLEINTQPMFTSFDAASGGALCEAMLEALLEPVRLA